MENFSVDMIKISVAVVFLIIFFVVLSNNKKQKSQLISISEPIVGNGNYNLVILDIENKNKIEVLKEIRAITNFDLYYAKTAIENLPFTLLKNVDIEYAQEIKEHLEKCGAVISIEKENIQ